MTAEQQQQFLDRSRQTEIMDELHGLRDVLEEVRSEARITNGRITRLEVEQAAQHSMLYGSSTDLAGGSGVVGMLRQLKRGQAVTIGLLTGVAVPAVLTVLGTYLPGLL